ncbi:MAG TPA: glycosyltransferase family 2 protein [Anaerolineae bacterium]|nr:glycosyltransferase family 2 protein [Caldilineae bacterium]HID35486.1 glycosyltransferase family 2 protein [Anaerolineae bacterium]
MSILIIIPAHNEADNLPHILPRLKEVIPEADVLVVDDHSGDATALVARQLGAQVVRLPNNLGYGGAVQTGFRFGAEQGYDFAVMMDADGQHDPAFAPDLLAPVMAGECDVALGSRHMGGMTYEAGLVRKMGMKLFAWITSALTGQKVTDATSGFQAMNRDVMSFFSEENYPSDFPDADTLIMLHFAGFSVKEVPVVMHERIAGESMHGNAMKNLYYIAKMLLSIFMVYLRYHTQAGALRPNATAEAAS